MVSDSVFVFRQWLGVHGNQISQPVEVVPQIDIFGFGMQILGPALIVWILAARCVLQSLLPDVIKLYSICRCCNQFDIFKQEVQPKSQNPFCMFCVQWGKCSDPIMTCVGRLHPKEIPFLGFRCIKGQGFHGLENILDVLSKMLFIAQFQGFRKGMQC